MENRLQTRAQEQHLDTFPDLTGFDLSDLSAFLNNVDPEWLAQSGRSSASRESSRAVDGRPDPKASKISRGED